MLLYLDLLFGVTKKWSDNFWVFNFRLHKVNFFSLRKLALESQTNLRFELWYFYCLNFKLKRKLRVLLNFSCLNIANNALRSSNCQEVDLKALGFVKFLMGYLISKAQKILIDFLILFIMTDEKSKHFGLRSKLSDYQLPR